MSEFTVEPLVVPKSISASDAADFIAAQDVINRERAIIIGSHDFSRTAEERLPYMRAPGTKRLELVAKTRSKIVGWARYDTLDASGTRECTLEAFVDGGHRRRGIGSALLEEMFRAAETDERTEFLTHIAAEKGTDGNRVSAASGAGSLAANSDGVAFVINRGFTLQQVDQISRLPLPVPPAVLGERAATAAAAYGDEYDLLRWAAPTPEVYRDDIARLVTEMSTADPIPGQKPTEDRWDAERLTKFEALEQGSPREKLYAAARHRPTGSLVGFTMLDVSSAPDGAVNQWSTLVTAAHRGKRLGLAMKLENIRQLMEDYPGHPSVTTMNAEDNRAMVAVNESVGFMVVGHVGSFRLERDPPRQA